MNNSQVMLYIHDREAALRSKQDGNFRSGSTEKFWGFKVGEGKVILDVKIKPLELYVEEDVLNVIGYLKKRVTSDGSKNKKTRHNEYTLLKKNIYSDQIYLP